MHAQLKHLKAPMCNLAGDRSFIAGGGPLKEHGNVSRGDACKCDFGMSYGLYWYG